MEEDMLLQRILMDADQVTRSGSKISGLFSKNESAKGAKDDVLKDFQGKFDDCQMTDIDCNSLLPLPCYELSQHIQLDIPTTSVLGEVDWNLGCFDVENIDCSIFAELSDLVTTEGIAEVVGPKSEQPPVPSQPSDSRDFTTGNDDPVSESFTHVPVALISVTSNFLDHNYAAVVPKIPSVPPIVESTCAAPCERDFGEIEVSKTVKYVERRKKNNLASRRSRETRKRKHVEMQEQVFQLERRNAELRDRVAKMEWLSCTMKRSLFRKIDMPSAFTN